MKGFVKSVVSLSLVLGLACAAEAKTVLNLDFLSNEGTAEHAPFSPAELTALLALAQKGIGTLIQIQKSALVDAAHA